MGQGDSNALSGVVADLVAITVEGGVASFIVLLVDMLDPKRVFGLLVA
jgi:hypothetical protein